MITHFAFIQGSYSWEITFGLAIISFVVGMIFKSGVLFKQRKRILHLENEMLSNHSRILTLEKRIADYKGSVHVDLEVISNRNTEREARVS